MSRNFRQNGSSPLILLLVISVLVLAAGGYYLFNQSKSSGGSILELGKPSLKVEDNTDSNSSSLLPDWFAYEHYGKRVKVRLPARPDRDTVEVEIAPGKTMLMDVRTAKAPDGSTYVIKLALMPLDVDTSNSQNILDKFITDTTNSDGVSSLTSTNTEYTGNKAVDLNYKLDSSEGLLNAHERIIVDNKLFVRVSAFSKVEKPVDYDNFLGSVELY